VIITIESKTPSGARFSLTWSSENKHLTREFTRQEGVLLLGRIQNYWCSSIIGLLQINRKLETDENIEHLRIL